jgi:alpha-tubulin suppressor-like RCC1 family protein
MAPAIVTHPAPQTVTVGQAATFSVAVNGAPTPSLQWRKNGTDITGANAASYTTPPATLADNGAAFSVVATNSAGSVTSNPAVLTVNATTAAPVVTLQPQNQSITAGGNATFTSTASGTPTPSVVWYATRPPSLDQQLRDGANAVCEGTTALTVSGSATVTLALSNVPVGCNGLRLRARFANAAGVAESNAAVLTVTAPVQGLAITQQPQSIARDLGQSATFTVVTTGPGTQTYQWLRSDDGGTTLIEISGANEASYTLNPMNCRDAFAQFVVRVRDSVETGTILQSTPAQLDLTPATPVTPMINASDRSAIALSRDGWAWGWGFDQGGVITGVGLPPTTKIRPERIRNACRLTQVSAGDLHNLGLRADGTVFAWGSCSIAGELGLPFASPSVCGAERRLEGVLVPGLANITQVSTGRGFSLALRSDGTVWAWGNNGAGALGGNATGQQVVSTPVQVPGLSNIVAIAAGTVSSAAVRADGTVWTWGNNGGISGNVDTSGRLGLNLQQPNVVVGTAQQVMGLTGITHVWASTESLLGQRFFARRNDGVLFGWGANYGGVVSPLLTTVPRVDPPAEVTVVTGVASGAAGQLHTVIINGTGAVISWGYNDTGVFGNGATTAGPFQGPATAAGLTGVRQVAASGYTTLVLRTDGTVWSIGVNLYGLLGTGNEDTSAVSSTAQQIPNFDLDPTQ